MPLFFKKERKKMMLFLNVKGPFCIMLGGLDNLFNVQASN